jgi:hypothetical protein
MVLATEETMWRARSMEMDVSSGQMGAPILDNFMKTTSKALVRLLLINQYRRLLMV